MQDNAENTLSVDKQPSVFNTPSDIVEILPDTSIKTQVRLYEILPLLLDPVNPLSVQDIADRYGVHNSTIYRALQRVDFAPLVEYLAVSAAQDIALVESPDRRGWLKVMLLGKLHSKKLKSESTVKIHAIEDKRSISVVLDKLDFDTQRKIAEALQQQEET